MRRIERRDKRSCSHRRRTETEAKAKVVASVWGATFIKFLAALADLHRMIFKKRLNSLYSFICYMYKEIYEQPKPPVPVGREDNLFSLSKISFPWSQMRFLGEYPCTRLLFLFFTFRVFFLFPSE